MRSLRATVLFLAAGNFVVGTSGFLVIGILPEITADLAISATMAGMLFTVYAAAYAIASPVMISATGGVGRRRLLLACLTAILLASVVCALTRDFSLMLAARVLAAVAGGVYTPVAASVTYALVPPERRSRALAINLAGLQLSQAAGLPLGVGIAAQMGWPAGFAMIAVLAVVAAVGLWRVLPGTVEVPVISLRTLALAGRDLRALVAVSLMALHTGTLCICYAYVAPLALRHEGSIGLTLAAFGIGGVAGGVMIGRLVAWAGASRARLLSIASQVLILPILSLPLLGAGPLGTGAMAALAFVWHFGAGGMMIPQQIILMQRNPDRGPVFLGLNATMNYLGVAVGSGIGALVLSGASLDWLGVVGGLCAAIAVLVALQSERLYRVQPITLK